MEAIDHINFEFMGDGTNIGKEIQHGITREVEQDDINTLNKEILKASSVKRICDVKGLFEQRGDLALPFNKKSMKKTLP